MVVIPQTYLKNTISSSTETVLNGVKYFKETDQDHGYGFNKSYLNQIILVAKF